MLFNSATYLFTNYNHRAVGLLPNSSRIFSLDYSTWVLERRRNMAWRPSSRLWQRLWQISRVHREIPWNLQPSTGTHRNSLKIFGSSSRAWRVGTHSKVYLTKMVIPHDWNIRSISWVPSDEGSTSSGTPLVKPQRKERRIRRVPSSLWSSYTAPWITLFLNDAGFTSLKRSG